MKQQELIKDYDQLCEDQKHLIIRNEIQEHNKSLTVAAKNVGVIGSRDIAGFQIGEIQRNRHRKGNAIMIAWLMIISLFESNKIYDDENGTV